MSKEATPSRSLGLGKPRRLSECTRLLSETFLLPRMRSPNGCQRDDATRNSYLERALPRNDRQRLFFLKKDNQCFHQPRSHTLHPRRSRPMVQSPPKLRLLVRTLLKTTALEKNDKRIVSSIANVPANPCTYAFLFICNCHQPNESPLSSTGHRPLRMPLAEISSGRVPQPGTLFPLLTSLRHPACRHLSVVCN